VQFYKAEVMNVHPSEPTAVVRFVGYGNSEEVLFENMRPDKVIVSMFLTFFIQRRFHLQVTGRQGCSLFVSYFLYRISICLDNHLIDDVFTNNQLCLSTFTEYQFVSTFSLSISNSAGRPPL